MRGSTCLKISTRLPSGCQLLSTSARTTLTNDESLRLMNRIPRLRQPDVDEVFRSPIRQDPIPFSLGDSDQTPVRGVHSECSFWEDHAYRTPPDRKAVNYEPPIQGVLFEDSPEGSNAVGNRDESSQATTSRTHPTEVQNKNRWNRDSFKFFYDENVAQFIDLEKDAGLWKHSISGSKMQLLTFH